jgi:prepilin-type N-terminal cleavage/methylation domain-containing protein
MIQRLQAKRNEEGFTLIELLIVIIVLGILAAIVVFAVAGTRGDAVASKCKTDVKSIELSAEAVLAKTGSYPTVVNSSNDANTNLLSGGTNGALLKEWPSDSDYIVQWDGDSVEVFNKSKFPAANGGGTVDVWNEAGHTTAATPVSCTAGL